MFKKLKKNVTQTVDTVFPKMMRMPSSSDLLWLEPEQLLQNLSNELTRTQIEPDLVILKPSRKRRQK